MDFNGNDIKSDLISMINDRQEVTYNELMAFASSLSVDENVLKSSLSEL